MRRQYTGQQRSRLVELVRDGHATVREAAARLGVAPATAYYWLKRGRFETRGGRAWRRAADQATPRFVRLLPGGVVDATVVVRVGGAEVQVRQGFDADLLRAVVTALQEGTP